ncbi:hypothetical protein [Micromonospora wenchangensis]|uniref:hypothetical protein n=1 Tax=Micromonospora wenchangensis TaxID=1185415 RepID=UPI003D72FB23
MSDLTPPAAFGRTGTMPSATERVAWLLRCNRLLGADGGWAQAKRFAAAFRGGSWTGSVTESRISRWETGVVRPPSAAVTRYEELLQLPEGKLAAVVAVLRRHARGHDGAATAADRWPVTPGDEEQLDELLDRALSPAVMTGAQWDRLSGLVAARPGLVLTPRSARARMTERLVSEMIIASGVPWQQRFEALNRLLGHPSCGPAAVAACADLGADRENQIFIEVVGALDATGHPDANRGVLRQLDDPTNDRALCGALLACERKIRFGHFTPEQLRVVAGTVDDLLTDPVHAEDAQVLAGLLTRRGHRFRAATNSPPRRAPGAHGPVPTPAEAATAGRIARTVMAQLGGNPTVTLGETLSCLVAEILFHPVNDVRLYTAMLVAATPCGPPLARALAAELEPTRGDRLAANLRILTAVRVLGDDPERPAVERIVVAANLPAELVRAACFGLGHLRGASTRRFWTDAVTRHLDSWTRTGDDTRLAALTGIVYSLGICGDDILLRRVRDTCDAPDVVRRAATWWLGIPGHVRRSAAR